MHFTSAVIFAASALQFTSVFAQAGCPSGLSTYAPAQNTCSKYYPVKTVTVSVPGSPSMTSPTVHQGAVTPAPTTSAAGGKRTVTSVVEKTVTDCRSAIDYSTCKFALPTNLVDLPVVGPLLGEFGLNRRDAQPESNPDPFFFGGSLGSLFGSNPALTWASVMAKGPAAVESACSCVQGPAKTVTVTASAKS